MGTLLYAGSNLVDLQKAPLFDVDTSYAEIYRRHALPLMAGDPEEVKSLDLDDDAARYTALEHPDITIRTWY